MASARSPIDIRKRLAVFAKEKRPYLAYYVDRRSALIAVLMKVMRDVLECLDKETEFRLVPYSLTFGFGYEKGWGDFFMPFCKEERFHLLDKVLSFVVNLVPVRIWHPPGLVWRILRLGFMMPFRFYFRYLRKIRHSMLYECAVIDPTKTYTLAGYERPLNYLEAFSLVLPEIWRCTPEVEREIAERRKQIKLLPKEYIAVHVRRGDKQNSALYVPVPTYVKHIEALARTLPLKKKVFLMTDDYKMFGELRTAMPGWDIHTLCSPESTGNVTHEWAKTPAAHKRETRLSFLTELMIAKDAQYFFGTIASGVTPFLSMLREKNTSFHVDEHLHPYFLGMKKAFDEIHAHAAALHKQALAQA